MQQAKFSKIGNVVVIVCPYHPDLVAEIEAIPDCQYSSDFMGKQAWSVPQQYEDQAHFIVRKYFPIQGEEPLAVIRLEFIAENLFAYRRQASEHHLATERYASYLGHNQSRPWVARLTGFDPFFGYIREFLHGRIDYSQSNSVGSRGVYLYFHLEPGMYEVFERVTWKRTRRYFIKVENAIYQEISKEEVDQWLSRDLE